MVIPMGLVLDIVGIGQGTGVSQRTSGETLFQQYSVLIFEKGS